MVESSLQWQNFGTRKALQKSKDTRGQQGALKQTEEACEMMNPNQ